MSSTAEAFIALGGNVGDVRETFRAVCARDLPDHGIDVFIRSSAYRTQALTLNSDEVQDDYWNAVVGVRTELSPTELMRALIAIENAHGRERVRRWAPRTLDLDLLLYGELEMRTDAVEVPHPRLRERAFVLVPLAELAPDLALPGGGSVRDALDQLGEPVEGGILERDPSFA